jgi:branched-chain amino acid aminotransferase
VSFVNLNGVMCDAADARLSVFDHGLLYGMGVFETVRGYGGRLVRMGAHLERLRAGAAVLGIAVPWLDPDLERAVTETLIANEAPNGVARLTVTRGTGAGGPGAIPDGPPSFFVSVRSDRSGTAPPASYRAIVSGLRQDGANPLARIKSLNFALRILARQEATRAGAQEALLLNERGELVEASMANLFLRVDGRLLTPPIDAGCLPGITRAAVLELAAAHGIPAAEASLPLSALAAAGEAFLTNSAIEVVPVVRIGGAAVGDGRPGPVTRSLQRAYRELVAKETEG